jgi:Family of unknown function (DUF5681)
MKPEKAAPKTGRAHLFKKGQSGNPAGRPVGSRNRTTIALEALLDGEGEALTRKAIEMAKGGDATAMRLCLDRIISPRKDRPVVNFQMPSIEGPEDAAKASAALIDAVGRGDITPGEAGEMGKLIDSYIRSIEVHDFEQRLARLEQSNGTAI